jgi:hypothetical protein
VIRGLRGRLLAEAFLEDRAHAERWAAGETRRRTALAASRTHAASLGPASALRAMCDLGAEPLLCALGFEPLSDREPLDDAIAAGTRAHGARVAVVVCRWGQPLEPMWRIAVGAARRRSAEWTLLFNGGQLAVVDAVRVYSRRCTQLDVDAALADDLAVTVLCGIFGADAYAVQTGTSPLRALVEASDRFAASVCGSLRDGVLTASADVLRALLAIGAPPPVAEGFEQALTIVYRILFLLFAEARGLVPVWHPVYRESYSVDALRAAAEAPGSAAGLWDALRAIGRLAHAGCRAGDLRVTPFNGRLFAPSRTPLAERRHLDDEAARRAIVALSTRPAADGRGRERISYRDLGVEQLGAVYETLLDYEPKVIAPAAPRASIRRRRPTVTLERGSPARKETGSFYTPQPLADYLVRRTLAPLTEQASSDAILRLRVLDPAMGSGAFLVAACQHLAAAYERALVSEGGVHPSDLDEDGRARIRRTVAERCLYGVDLNPTAVQLARLSLWLTTLSADRPLTFLDHRLVAGDSLVGASLASLRQAPKVGARRRPSDTATLPLFDRAELQAALAHALPVRFSLEGASDTLDQVRRKERALAALGARQSAIATWKQVADLWCAAWFAPPGQAIAGRLFDDLADALLKGRGSLPPRTADGPLAAAAAIAQVCRFVHWELEFPEVFFDADGGRRTAAGFDAVIGNPPWDMLRADSGPDGRRSDARRHIGALMRFTRDSGAYDAQSDGHVNRYQLFTERALSLCRPGARIGLVLPAGLIMDRGSAKLRRRLFAACDVDAIVGFENHGAIFPVHRSVRFLLLTGTSGTASRRIGCRLGERDPTSLEHDTTESFCPVTITPSALERLSGPDLSMPWVTAAADLAIAERAAALYPPLGSPAGWRAQFGRDLNATDDRGVLRPRGHGLPLVEGKHIVPFRAALDRCTRSVSEPDAASRFADRRFARPRLAYRDVASATNRLTLIAAVLPPGCVTTHTVFCLRSPLPASAQHLLCGLFNSFIVNFLVRQRVSTHVTTAIVERLPLPRWSDAPRACAEIAALARRLARRDDERALAALNARAAALYQLSAAEYEHVLGTFPLIAGEVREACLRTYAATETRGA